MSSGVGTGSSGTSNGSGSLQQEPAAGPAPSAPSPAPIRPGMHVVCLENHSDHSDPNALHIEQGDIIEGKEGMKHTLCLCLRLHKCRKASERASNHLLSPLRGLSHFPSLFSWEKSRDCCITTLGGKEGSYLHTVYVEY